MALTGKTTAVVVFSCNGEGFSWTDVGPNVQSIEVRSLTVIMHTN